MHDLYLAVGTRPEMVGVKGLDSWHQRVGCSSGEIIDPQCREERSGGGKEEKGGV